MNNLKKFTHGDFYNNIKNTVLIEQFIYYIYPRFTAYKATFGIFRQNLFPNPLFFPFNLLFIFDESLYYG